MFDANMRHLRKGYRFFAEVHSCSEGSSLYEAGVRTGDILFAIMLSIGHNNPRVKFFLKDGKSIISRSWEEGVDTKYLGSLLVYAGSEDMSGFIHDNVKQKAKEILDNLKDLK